MNVLVREQYGDRHLAGLGLDDALYSPTGVVVRKGILYGMHLWCDAACTDDGLKAER